ncbi:MAG: hypothetical protein HC804_00130 [Anaerolineae bacterium]|nr:hypothetical protein [Anaerolineae bacterium]
MKIVLQGLDDVEKQLERVQRGTKAMGNYQGQVGSRLPYAWGMEFGRHRVSGKMARRAGGVQYITRAVETVLSGADHDISEGLNKVTAPGPWVIRRLALWARRLARANAPKGPKTKSHSYRLRRSINYRVTKN